MTYVYDVGMIRLSRAQKDALIAISELPPDSGDTIGALAKATGKRVQAPTLQRLFDLGLVVRDGGTYYANQRGWGWLQRFGPKPLMEKTMAFEPISMGRLKALRGHMQKAALGDAPPSLVGPDVGTISRALEFAVEIAGRPCQVGHVDKKRCWEHERDWARDQWCEPCLCEHVVLRGGKL